MVHVVRNYNIPFDTVDGSNGTKGDEGGNTLGNALLG